MALIGNVAALALLLALASGPMAQAKSKGEPDAVHWGYDGAGAPAHWGTLQPEFIECSEGSAQSPIDLTAPASHARTTIRFDYKPAPLDVVNNGHAIQVNYAPGSFIEINGARYALLQFHFHTPSEHALAGAQFPMEVHLVHRNEDGVLAVVGVFLAGAADNPVLHAIWRRMPATPGPAVRYGDVNVNAAELLPTRRQFYRYMGSLTTPPCSEGVNWFVADQPVVVGVEQVQQIRAITGANARPLQPLNERLLTAPPAQ